MRKKLHDRWLEFKSGHPGTRFQEDFARRHKLNKGRYNLSKLLHIGGGAVFVFVGLFLLAAPGPGLLVIMAGLGLLGGEFLTLAKMLDWLEVRIRKWCHGIAGFWKRRSLAVKILIVLSLVAVLAAGSYFVVEWFWKRH